MRLECSHNTAIVQGDQAISFSELRALVDHKYKVLRKFPESATFALIAENSIAFVSTLLAAMQIRPVAILSSKWTESEIQTRLQTLKSYCLLSHDFSEVQGIQNTSHSIHPHTELILFTSGSCGNPKAVQLSKANRIANTEAVIESLRFREASLQDLHLPLSYSFGLLGQLFPALEVGLTTYLYSEVMELAGVFSERSSLGMLSAVPEQWQFLVEFARSHTEAAHSASHIISAGSRLNANLRKELRDAFPNAVLFNNYGMTECSPRILSLSSDDPAFFSEAVGRPVKGLSVSFTDDGVLRIQGSQVMLAYVDGASTNSTLLSGDLGFEKEGIVFLNGRRDDLVKISGERISCQDVTSRIREADCVQDAYVLPYDDANYGKRLAAFVVLKDASKEDFKSFVRQNLSGNAKPSKIHFLDKLPINSNSKIDRNALLKEFL